MPVRLFAAFFILALAFNMPSASQANNANADAAPSSKIMVKDIWSPPSTSLVSGVAYGAIENIGNVDDTLVGFTAARIAKNPELHTHEMQGDVFRMRKIASLALLAGSTQQFEPGGLHFMLIGLLHKLEDGASYKMTLHFKHHPDITVTVPVSKARLIAHLKSRNTASQHH